ncbi:MAG: single-stranded DNA-binding protein [Clostridiales bacterium]|nr:single-stranded DNA-binding protein [Candidatus Crickella caballi]
MNSVVLIGRLTRDPELSFTPNTQTAVAHFSIAVDRPRRNGEDQGADFIRITVFGKQAETVDRYLSKGRQVAVQGRIQTGSYKNREGVTVYTTDVIADRVEFIGGQGNGGQSNAGRGNATYDSPAGGFEAAPQDSFGGFDDMPDTFQAAEDDIPF